MTARGAMKVLLLTDNFLPHIGGSRVYYYNLMVRFPPGTVTVLTNAAIGWKEFDWTHGLTVVRVPLGLFSGQLRWLWTVCIMIVRGISLLLREKSDVIYCGEIMTSGLAGYVLGSLFRVPYVVIVHAEDIGFLSKLDGEKKLGRLVLIRASLLVAACEYVRKKYREMGAEDEKIMLLTPAVSEEFVEEVPGEDIARFKSDKGIAGARVVLTAGRLIERKNQGGLIDAMAMVVRYVPEAVCVIIGDGPERPELERRAVEHGIRDRVRFEGDVCAEDLRRWYAACDAFVMVSKELPSGDREGVGIVLMEAAAQRKPVIGSTVGSAGIFIDDGRTGILVDPYKASELADAIVKILKDRDLARTLGEAAREKVMRQFRYRERAEALYERSRMVLEMRSP